MAIGMAHRRNSPEPRSISSAATASVAAPTAVPAPGDAPAGTSSRRAVARGMAVTAIIMNATPATTGVMIRRNCASQAAVANCTSELATTRLDMSASPPASAASTATARNWTLGPVRRM